MSFFGHLLPGGPPNRVGVNNSQIRSSSSNEIETKFVKANFQSFISTPVPSVSKSKQQKKEDIVSRIDVKEYDIFKINSVIKKNLSCRHASLQTLYTKLNNTLWIINNSSDPIDILQSQNTIINLREEIKDIENSFELTLYILQTQNILLEYQNLAKKNTNSSFFESRKKSPQDEIKKEELMLNFLRVAQNYIKLENFKKKTFLYCKDCFGTEFDFEPASNEKICKQCALGVSILDDSPCFKDSDRVNMSTRYKYICRSHFVAAMDQFEGKQNSNVAGVVLVLEKEMEDHSLTESTLRKSHIYMFLSDKKLSDHYKDINLLYFCLTGKKPPDISGIRDELLSMYSKVMEVYEDIKDPERQNSLNVGFMFRNLLWLLDFECDSDNFFFLKTPTKAKEHNEKWREIIDELIKRYPNTTTSKGKLMWRHLNATIN